MKLFRWMNDEAHSHRCAALANGDAGASVAALPRNDERISGIRRPMLTQRRIGLQHRAKFVALMLIAGAITLATQPAIAMKLVGKSVGPTIPFLPHFSSAYAAPAAG